MAEDQTFPLTQVPMPWRVRDRWGSAWSVKRQDGDSEAQESLDSEPGAEADPPSFPEAAEGMRRLCRDASDSI